METASPDQLLPAVYEELRALAARYRSERPMESLQPTGLVHEAWIRLARWQGRFESEGHFRAVAAKAMRQVLTDQVRRRLSDKRGGGYLHRTTLSGLADAASPIDLLDLEEALTDLEALDPLGAKIVELRYLGGMSVTETAAHLDMSRSSVQDSWRMTRAWLEARLAG